MVRETTRTTVEVEETQKQVKEAEVEVEKTTNEVIGAQRELDSKAKALEETTADAERERKAFEKALSDQKVAGGTANIDDVLALVAGQVAESKAVAEAKGAIEAALAAAADWRKFLGRLFSVRGLAVLAVCVAGPVVAHYMQQAWATALGAAAAGVASFSSVLKFVKENRDQFEEKWKKLEAEEEARNQALQRALQQKWEAKRSALLNELEGRRATLSALKEAASKAARELAARSKELDSKLSARVEAEAKLSEARATLDRLSSALMLDEFLKDRSGTGDYRKRLSLLALVRRDFERLSDLIVEANEEWRNPSENKPPPLLNRNVLYIDDLDRCSEKTVLAVLEVVHLLLAFPLFVCVVAVDPRWIEKCLREKHKKLFVGAGKAGDPVAPNDAGTDPDAGVTVGGTSATRRQSSDSGSRSTATVPSLNGFFKAMRTRPSGPGKSRSLASGGRKMYLSRASRPPSSKAPAPVAACRLKPGRRALVRAERARLGAHRRWATLARWRAATTLTAAGAGAGGGRASGGAAARAAGVRVLHGVPLAALGYGQHARAVVGPRGGGRR